MDTLFPIQGTNVILTLSSSVNTERSCKVLHLYNTKCSFSKDERILFCSSSPGATLREQHTSVMCLWWPYMLIGLTVDPD